MDLIRKMLLTGVHCAVVLLGCSELQDTSPEQQMSYSSATELGSFCDRLPRTAYAGLQKHASSNDWFEIYEVEASIFAIYEPFQWQEVISWLIVGTESAVLFDTGNGIGDIRAVVDQLTDRPVRVINSHSHFDHIGGNYQFDEVLSIATEFTLARTHGIESDQLRMEVSPDALCRSLPEGVSEAAHRIQPFSITGKISDGDVVDIGGRQLEIMHIPGHTPDSIALLDRDSGYLWSGDSIYEGPIWLFFPETDLVAYRASVAKLAAVATGLKAVFPGHNTPRANPELLLQLRENLDRVLTGQVEPTPVGDGNVEFAFQGFSFLMREDYHNLSAE